jgi:hypothetical protein
MMMMIEWQLLQTTQMHKMEEECVKQIEIKYFEVILINSIQSIDRKSKEGRVVVDVVVDFTPLSLSWWWWC